MHSIKEEKKMKIQISSVKISSVRVSSDYLTTLAMQENFTTLHYKVMLILLSGKTYTKAQLAMKLGKYPQNLTQPIKDLMQQGYIDVERIEGRNKFLKAVLK